MRFFLGYFAVAAIVFAFIWIDSRGEYVMSQAVPKNHRIASSDIIRVEYDTQEDACGKPSKAPLEPKTLPPLLRWDRERVLAPFDAGEPGIVGRYTKGPLQKSDRVCYKENTTAGPDESVGKSSFVFSIPLAWLIDAFTIQEGMHVKLCGGATACIAQATIKAIACDAGGTNCSAIVEAPIELQTNAINLLSAVADKSKPAVQLIGTGPPASGT